MKINWYPGHMKKTMESLSENISKVDLVLYVLDARAPLSCLNPSISEIAKNKSILYVFNKIDLANQNTVKKNIENFENNKKAAVSVNSLSNLNKSKLIEKIKNSESVKKKIAKNKAVNPIIKLMVVGVPNSGKSALINKLSSKYKAETGNKPGVTKQVQWLRVDDNIRVLDTPGTLWPKSSEQMKLKRLAYLGSIRDSVLNIEDLVFELLKDLIPEYEDSISKRYGIEIKKDHEIIDIYNNIAESKNFYLKSGEIDYYKTANMIINDFRSAKFGNITLDNYNQDENEK